MASLSENLSVAAQVARIKRKVRAIAPAVKPAVQAQIEADAAKLVQAQKRLGGWHDRTGDLRGDIAWAKLKGGRVGVTVYAGDYKARWFEFGTEKMRARPFFFGPWRAMKKTIKANIRKATRQAGKQAVK